MNEASYCRGQCNDILDKLIKNLFSINYLLSENRFMLE